MKIVCVTGMHRSGTSLIGRVVNLLGVSLGPEDQLMQPKPDNPAGFWENSSISALNDDILGALGGSWSDPPVLDEGWEHEERLDPFRQQAGSVLADVLAGDDPPDVAGWKDPRTSLLLPFWRTVAPVDATILTIRDPRDVAGSLAARDGIGPEDAAHLWLRYTAAAWRADPGRLVMSYDAVLADPAEQAARLVKHLGLPEPDDAAAAAIADFADPALRHHRDDALPEGPEMQAAAAVYGLMLRGDTEVLDVVFESFHAGWIAAREMAELEHRLAGVRRELELAIAHRDEVVAERDQALASRDEVKAQLEDERSTLLAQRAELEAQMAEERAVLAAQVAETRAQMAEERATLAAQVAETRAQMEEERAALTAQRDELAAHRDAVLAERDLALAGRDELAAQLEDERAALSAQISHLTDQLEGDRAALTAQRDEAAAHRDLALADRDRVRDERDHFEARVGVQGELLARSEAELQRIRRMLAQAEATAAELERRNIELEQTVRRWRIDRLQRIVWRLRALLRMGRSG